MSPGKRQKFVGILLCLGMVGLPCWLLLTQRSLIRNQERLSQQIEELGLFVRLIAEYPEKADGNQVQLTQQIEEVSRVVNRLAGLPENTKDSQRAVALGREAIQSGQWELGQVYLVNAITNAPRVVEQLDQYAATILEHDDPPLDAVERLSSMLQLAAYQVDAGDVPTVVALIEQAEDARSQRVAQSISGSSLDKTDDFRGRWEHLTQIDPGIWNDHHTLALHLEDLEEFVEAIADQAFPAEDVKSEAIAELLKWSEIAQAVRQCEYIDNCLERLQDDEDLATQRAVAIIQAAENALPNFWGLSVGLPADLKARIDGYPVRIQQKVSEIGSARSETITKRIEEALAEDYKKLSKWEDKCQFLENQINKAQKLAVQLSSMEAMHRAQKLIEDKSKELTKCRNNQFYQYQNWVIERSDSAFKEYISYSFHVGEKNAREIFRKSGLAKIDQSLLSPEVSRFFNDVLGKLTGEMSVRALVVTEREMAATTTTKMRLEDF